MFSYVSNIASLILGFIARTIFINTLGTTYIGVNGLFLNILNVLSFSELGIGTAINFALYKPLADKDISKLKSLMYLYKKAYRIIAIIILIVGVGLVPFLRVLVKDGEGVENLSFIYLIFLFNTVSSYFATYKFTLIIADQKKYIITIIDLCGYICMVIIQIILLKVYKNFIIYLVAGVLIQLAFKIFSNLYINRKYPFLKDKNVEKLPKEEIDKIKVNVKALIMHKLGEISIYQTDSIIIASFISVKIVGLISNYNLIINSVWIFIGSIFSSATASLGSLIANDSEEKQYLIFKVYRLISFWLIGFSAIAFYILTEPFITLWIGNDKLIDNISFALIILNYYIAGDRTAAINMKQAAGNYKDDKYVSLLQGISNLIISIFLVSIIGLPGVYIGTILSSLIPNIIRPYMLYKNTLNKKFSLYIKDSIYYFFSVLICVFILRYCSVFILTSLNIVRFILLSIIVMVLPNLIFILFYYKTEEFKYIQNILKKVKNKIIINKIIRRTGAKLMSKVGNSRVKKLLIWIWNKTIDCKNSVHYFIKRIIDVIRRKILPMPEIMTIEETIQQIINNKCSVSRYGDGELKIIDGDRIFFQEYNKELSQRLAYILKSGSDDCLICIPDCFDSLSKYTIRARKYTANIVADRRLNWYNHLNMNQKYGNAYISRFYSGFLDTSRTGIWFEMIKKIWDKREIILIEGEKSRLGYGNDLFVNANSVKRVLCPAMNAYSCYDEIIDYIKNLEKKYLILCALGPTATVLAYDLNKLGFQSIDIGHIDIEYEWYLRKDQSHKKIDNKFVSEAENGNVVNDLYDPEYLSQIIKVIETNNEVDK